MRYRFVEYKGDIYIGIGQGYDSNFDPPEILIGIPLEHSVHRSLLMNLVETRIPLFQAIEITDKNRIKTLLVLYGR